MTPFSSELLTATASADLTIDAGDNIYLCYFDRSAKLAPGVPAEEQPIWRIILIEKVTIDDTTQYRRKYPNGLQGFMFAPSQASSYTYKY